MNAADVNFHSNGDVFYKNTYIGRIDTEGHWRAEEGFCDVSQDQLLKLLQEQLDDPQLDFNVPVELLLRFARS